MDVQVFALVAMTLAVFWLIYQVLEKAKEAKAYREEAYSYQEQSEALKKVCDEKGELLKKQQNDAEDLMSIAQNLEDNNQLLETANEALMQQLDEMQKAFNKKAQTTATYKQLIAKIQALVNKLRDEDFMLSNYKLRKQLLTAIRNEVEKLITNH